MVGKRQRNRHYQPSPSYFRHLGEEGLFRQYAIDRIQFADSWRNYRVGGSGIGVKSDGTYVRLSGHNSKAAPGPRRRGDKCAAMRIIDDAVAKDCVILEMWEAHEEPQADDKTKLHLGFTISCVHCRARYKTELLKPRGRVKRKTRVNFVDSTNPRRMRPFSVEQILRVCS